MEINVRSEYLYKTENNLCVTNLLTKVMLHRTKAFIFIRHIEAQIAYLTCSRRTFREIIHGSNRCWYQGMYGKQHLLCLHFKGLKLFLNSTRPHLLRIVTVHLTHFDQVRTSTGHMVFADWKLVTLAIHFRTGSVLHCAFWQNCPCFLLKVDCWLTVHLVAILSEQCSFRHNNFANLNSVF